MALDLSVCLSIPLAVGVNIMITKSQRIRGWYAFDWASQPYHTLILTFIFAPYFAVVVGDAVIAQKYIGATLTVTGLASAVLAPVIGALANQSGRLIRWVAGLSVIYVVSCAALWFAVPGATVLIPILFFFGTGLVATELAIIITNAFLPSLAERHEVGRISGNGYAIGYAGGLIALVLMLAFFAEDSNGQTILGLSPILGLDPDMREGTRFVGPFCLLWFAISMIPFFLWVKDPVRDGPDLSLIEAGRRAQQDLKRMLRHTLGRRSLLAFLGSSMFYRDALNGLYSFGGIYAAGVMGWSVIQVGVFGILGVASAGLACWIGGKFDAERGPKPVITVSILVLMAVCFTVVGLTREGIYSLSFAPTSAAPDVILYLCGALIGGAGGTLQSASRSLMVAHADPQRPTEAFGLYALSGKATAFLAPLLVTMATVVTGDQRMGVSPLIALFLLGLILLVWVKKDGDI